MKPDSVPPDRSCPPHAVLEQIAVGAPVDAAHRAHVRTCVVCRTALAEIRANGRIPAGVPGKPGVAPRRHLMQAGIIAAVVLAVLGAMGLLWRVATSGPTALPPGVTATAPDRPADDAPPP